MERESPWEIGLGEGVRVNVLAKPSSWKLGVVHKVTPIALLLREKGVDSPEDYI